MIIPWKTDAPVYYFPYATIGIILANTLVFVATATMDYEQIQPYILNYGTIRPIQWVTSNFLHMGIFHLIGNMIFLWAFGLVVEGKVGWWRFLIIYLLIGIVQCAIEQTIALGMEGGSLGASAAIYGLLAISMVWAPENEISVIFILIFRPYMFEVSILFFAAFFIIWEFGWAVILGLTLSTLTSEFLHFSGAAVGFVVGTWMVKTNRVDCEGWDVYSRWARRIPKPSPPPAKLNPEAADMNQADLISRGKSAEEKIKFFAENGNGTAAMNLLEDTRRLVSHWKVDRTTLLQLIESLHKERRFKESIPYMVEILKVYPESSERVRLKLAQILIQKTEQPMQALRVLRKLDGKTLPEKLRQRYRQLKQVAESQCQAGAMEFETEDW